MANPTHSAHSPFHMLVAKPRVLIANLSPQSYHHQLLPVSSLHHSMTSGAVVLQSQPFNLWQSHSQVAALLRENSRDTHIDANSYTPGLQGQLSYNPGLSTCGTLTHRLPRCCGRTA
eukprot:1160018-Pelagomonas_calceolata.AAC.5